MLLFGSSTYWSIKNTALDQIYPQLFLEFLTYLLLDAVIEAGANEKGLKDVLDMDVIDDISIGSFDLGVCFF